MRAGEGRTRIPLRAKVVCVIAIAVPLLMGGVYLWFKAVEVRRWEGMRHELEELAREARARDPRRPVLRGVAESGNAWTEYEALFMAKPGSSVLRLAGDFLYGDRPPDRQKVDASLKGYEYFLDGLRRATQKSEAQRPIEWEKGMPGFYAYQNLSAYAVYQSRILKEGGRAREAAELLLDAGQYGEDIGRNVSFINVAIGLGIVARSLDELKDLVLSRECGGDDLLEVARELEILDRNYPSIGDAYVNTAMAWGFTFQNAGKVGALDNLGSEDIESIKTSLWRYGYSDRLLLADAFQTMLSAMRRLRAGATAGWKEDRDVQDSVRRYLETNPNPVVRIMRDGMAWTAPGGNCRECLARLRLLRTAAWFKARGEVLKLVDPFGDTLLFSRDDGRLKVWSVGPDGVDDGGVGEWKASKGKDIVLEVER